MSIKSLTSANELQVQLSSESFHYGLMDNVTAHAVEAKRLSHRHYWYCNTRLL